MNDIEVYSDCVHLTDEGHQILRRNLVNHLEQELEVQAHATLKAWSETDEGKAAIAMVGGVDKSNPLYLAFMAGFSAALAGDIQQK